MNLEHELRALPIAFPDEPDLAPRVLARLERPARRWWLVPALAALAVAGALFAIPQTRAAILDLFRIGGVEVQRVETQPRAPVRPPALGREVSFATAQRTVDFPLLSPRDPFTAYVDGPMVNLRWKRYVLSQWRGEQLPFAPEAGRAGLADRRRRGPRRARGSGSRARGTRSSTATRRPTRSWRNRAGWPETS